MGSLLLVVVLCVVLFVMVVMSLLSLLMVIVVVVGVGWSLMVFLILGLVWRWYVVCLSDFEIRNIIQNKKDQLDDIVDIRDKDRTIGFICGLECALND